MQIELIEKVFKKLLPVGSEIALNPSEVPIEHRYWVIPGKSGPRWIIPQEIKYGLHVFRQWRPYNITSHIKWKMLKSAYCLKQIGLIPGIKGIGIALNNKKEWNNIGWNSEPKPIPIVYLGTPCKTRKAVALLVDPLTQRLHTIVKIPLSEISAKRIIHEFNFLNYLKSKKIGISPIPLYLDNETGVATQKAIVGSPVRRRFSKNHWKIVKELSFSNQTTTVASHSQRIIAKLSEINKISVKIKTLLMKLAEESMNSSSLPSTIVHGDFVPWNFKKNSHGRLMALDWELGDTNGLPLYDFFYYFIMQSYLFDEKINEKTILGILSPIEKKYPIKEIKKLTLASIGLNIAKSTNATYYLEKFIRKINKTS